MISIKETLKKIYSVDNSLIKHVIIFTLTGIVGMLAIPINELSELKTLTSMQWLILFTCFCLTLLAGFYMFGYLYKSIHNSFSGELFDILPEFTAEPLKIGLKGLLIVLSWIGYAILIAAICSVIYAILRDVGFILFVLVGAIVILFFIMYPMVFVDFAKDYETKGLKYIAKPFTYIPETFSYIVVLLIKLFPVFILVLFMNALARLIPNVGTYIVAAFGGYFGWIFNLILNHGYADIFREKYIK